MGDRRSLDAEFAREFRNAWNRIALLIQTADEVGLRIVWRPEVGAEAELTGRKNPKLVITRRVEF